VGIDERRWCNDHGTDLHHGDAHTETFYTRHDFWRDQIKEGQKMTEVRLVDIEKRYGAFLALSKQSLTIESGEFLVLLGPSGCGKTTTMRMIAGLEDITSGDVLIDNDRVNDRPPKDRDIAMVFQNYGLYPHMNVAQNIGYPLKLRGMGKAERATRVLEIAEKVELEALLKRRPSELSGGQRQRVALARAIVRTPKIFLMDEPLSNLDAKLRVTMRAELKHLHHELGVTTIYVTHDQMEAMTLATRIAVMREGRIVQLDSPKKIYSEPIDLFVAGFIGSPSMNLIEGDVENGFFVAKGVKIPVQFSDRRDVVLGVRPEDLEIVKQELATIEAPVYALELTGESTLVTVKDSATSICVRGSADFEANIDEVCYIAPRTPEKLHLFDKSTGKRLNS
jgi:multiple sugar transport system ATP-binding protein